jgi:hypothetical protein
MMKRLDIKITGELDVALEDVREVTKRSRTHLVHDGISLLHWAKEVHSRGNTIGEVDPSTGQAVTVFYMSMFEGLKAVAKEKVIEVSSPEYDGVTEASQQKAAVLKEFLGNDDEVTKDNGQNPDPKFHFANATKDPDLAKYLSLKQDLTDEDVNQALLQARETVKELETVGG